MDPVILLRIIEEFLQYMPPAEWRRRAQGNIPMGDMPLRTVKVILQHIVCESSPVFYIAVIFLIICISLSEIWRRASIRSAECSVRRT